jgi:hypothetical protein
VGTAAAAGEGGAGSGIAAARFEESTEDLSPWFSLDRVRKYRNRERAASPTRATETVKARRA